MKKKTLFIKYFCTICLLSIISICYTQINDIQLPSGEVEVKIRKLTPIFSIYVDRYNNIYIEEEPIAIQNLARRLKYMHHKTSEDLRYWIYVHLYVDKRVDYTIVDQIKTEIAAAGIRRVAYKTGTIEDKDLLKGLYWKNHLSFVTYDDVKMIDVKKDIENTQTVFKSKKEKDLIDILPPPPPPPLHWIYGFEKGLYSFRKERIKEALSERKTYCIRLTNKGILTAHQEIINYDQEATLIKSIHSVDVLLISFDEQLTYESYIKAIKSLTIARNKVGRRKLYYVELSSELIEIYQKENIKICNF